MTAHPKNNAGDLHTQAAVYHTAAAADHQKAAHLHSIGQVDNAKKFAVSAHYNSEKAHQQTTSANDRSHQ